MPKTRPSASLARPDDGEVREGVIIDDPAQDPDDDAPAGDDDGGAEVSAPDLVFTTTAKPDRNPDVGKSTVFTIDGETFEALRPTDDAFVYLTTASARSTPMPDRMAAIIQFVDHALTEESGIRVRDRLLDRDDDFSFTDLLDVLHRLVQHWHVGKKTKKARARTRAR